MAKTATIIIDIDSELKEGVEAIFEEMGISMSEAITYFFEYVIINQGLPLGMEIPKHDSAFKSL